MRNVTFYHANATLTSVDAAYVIITNITCLTSMCGCLVTVLLFLMYPDIRTTARKMLVFLSVANFVQYLGAMLQAATFYQSLHFPDERKLLCASAASISVFGHVSSALWTCAVTLFIFMFLSFPAAAVRVHMVWICCFFCFGLPMLVALQGRYSDVYGYDITDILYFKHPTSCWISDRVANGLQWSLITVEGWVIAAYFFCLLFFVVINCVLYCKQRKTQNRKEGLSPVSSSEDLREQMTSQTVARHLRVVPILYCLLRVWGTAHFLFTEYPTKRHLRAFDWLMIFRAMGDNLQGFSTLIVFCVTTPKIRRMMVYRARCLCACCCVWCQRQKRRLAQEKWMPRPIVRMRRNVSGRSRRSVDGSDLDISGISLEVPLGGADFPDETEEEEARYEEDEVLFER